MCQPQLKADLTYSADILIIRTLEYLTPEALQLFVFAILNLAKPDSTFYFEIFNSGDSDTLLGGIVFHRNLRTGFVPSFFGPRTDIEFISHRITHNEELDKGAGDNTTVERLIVRKI